MREALRRHAAPIAGLLAASVLLLHRATARYFWNGDDAFELPMGRLLATGEWTAWWEASSLSGHTGLRVIPRFLWGLDYALHGGNAAGFYVTNVALHIACILAVYVLAFRLTDSRVGAVAGALTFGLLGPTAQVVSFLSAREDSIATLCFVLAVMLWDGVDGSRRRLGVVAGLYLVICFSKLSGVTLPGVLLAMDIARLGPREALGIRRLLRLFGPLAAVLGGMVAAWAAFIGLSGAGNYAALREGKAASILAANLYQGLFFPLADHPAEAHGTLDGGLVLAQAVLLPALAVIGLIRSDRATRAGALAWIALGLLPPAALLGWNAEQSWGDGRYFHLPSAGLALLVAAACRGKAWPIAVSTGALMVAAFSQLVVPQFAFQGQYTRHLARATEEASQTLADGGKLVVIWPRLDQGVRRMLDGGFLRSVAPSLPERFFVLPEGTQTLYAVSPDTSPRLDDVRIVRTGFRVSELQAGQDAAVMQGVKAHPIFDVGRRFTPVELPLKAPEADADAEVLRWDFAGGDAGWKQGPGLIGHQGFDLLVRPDGVPLPPGKGLHLTSTGALDWPGNPEPPSTLYLPELVSPPLGLDPLKVCGLSIDLTVSGAPAPEGRRQLEPWNFGVLTWATRTHGPYFGGALAFPVIDGEQTIDLDLGNSPSWRDSYAAHRLGLTPSARRADVVVAQITLRWCSK